MKKTLIVFAVIVLLVGLIAWFQIPQSKNDVQTIRKGGSTATFTTTGNLTGVELK